MNTMMTNEELQESINQTLRHIEHGEGFGVIMLSEQREQLKSHLRALLEAQAKRAVIAIDETRLPK